MPCTWRSTCATWIKNSSKIWAVGDEVVAFSATTLPRNWTLSDDAGFLPVALQQRGDLQPTALGTRDRDLVVFFKNSAQMWVPDPDPALHVFKHPIKGVGTDYQQSIAHVSDDLFFLSRQGYRSIAMTSTSDNLTDIDVGSPIDSIVAPLLTGSVNPVAEYYAGAGQYWCAIGSNVHTYTFSRTAKISAWSLYTYDGIAFEDMAELDGVLYFRDGDDVYKVDDTLYTDAGAN